MPVAKKKSKARRAADFKKGNKLAVGYGRPPLAVEKEYVKATIRRVSLDDWVVIVDKAKAQAAEGDAVAREWLARYLIGKQPLLASQINCPAPEPLID